MLFSCRSLLFIAAARFVQVPSWFMMIHIDRLLVYDTAIANDNL